MLEQSGMNGLTAREQEIARLAARGLSNKAIAAELGSAEGTVKRHLHSIFQKLEVYSRTELILKFPSGRVALH